MGSRSPRRVRSSWACPVPGTQEPLQGYITAAANMETSRRGSQLRTKRALCNQDTHRRASGGRKGLNGKAALSLSHGAEGLSCADPGSRTPFNCMPCSVPGWAEALPAFSSCQQPPTRGAHFHCRGWEAQIWERPAVAKRKPTQRYHKQSLGRGRDWARKEGCGEFSAAHSPSRLIKQNRRRKPPKEASQ